MDADHRRVLGYLVLFVAFLSGAGGAGSLWACPLCGAPTLTWSEQYARAEVVAVARLCQRTQGTDDRPTETHYRLEKIVRDPDDKLRVEQVIVIPADYPGAQGDQFLLWGHLDEKSFAWDEPLAVTPARLEYLLQAPPDAKTDPRRLAYFVKFLDSADQEVSNDAHAEFVNAPSKQIAAVADALPREQLRKWLANPELRGNRLALYSMLLGWCGDESDGQLLERILKAPVPPEVDRFGIEGVMGGILLLKRQAGLDLIDSKVLSRETAPVTEVVASIQAIRFMWADGGDRIDRDALRRALRRLVERAEIADLVVPDLARWKDWSLQERLIELYDDPKFQEVRIRKAILRFLVASSRVAAPADDAPPPPHAVAARRQIEKFRERDRELVENVERNFY